jgi:KDO2-lipid IV(A) lauroyltransferase
MRRILRQFRFWWEFAALYLLYGLARRTPHRWLRRWGRGLGLFACNVLRLRRRVVLDNLRAAFGDRFTQPERMALARRFYASLGETMLEFFVMGDMEPAEIRDAVSIEGIEHLDRIRGEGRGALLISGHYGNWELLGAAIAARGYPIGYLAKSQSNPHVDRIQNAIRARAGVGIIKQESAHRLLYALKRREFVGILADQNAGGEGLFVDFLGRPASVFRGPAYFAFRTQSPIVPVAIRRIGPGRHHVTVRPPLRVDPAWDEETAVRELTRAHVASLERFIREHPEHYFWVHRRWKTDPPPGTEVLRTGIDAT